MREFTYTSNSSRSRVLFKLQMSAFVCRSALKRNSYSISFRSDDWFIFDESFPVIYPFIRDPQITDVGAVKDAPEITCYRPGNQNSFNCLSMRMGIRVPSFAVP